VKLPVPVRPGRACCPRRSRLEFRGRETGEKRSRLVGRADAVVSRFTIDSFMSSAIDAPVLANPTARVPAGVGSRSLPAAGALPSNSTVEPLIEDYPLIAVVGPTASGKSVLGLVLAEHFRGEVINYDSVQVYRGFYIGSGKLPPGERRGIPHHLLDTVDAGRVFTAGDYRSAALKVLQSVRERGKLPVLVGGTGLYLRALILGLFDGPARSEQLRTRLRSMLDRRARSGDYLHRLLRRLDSETAARIHPRDTQKIIRALEVCLLARQPMSVMLRRSRDALRGFRTVKIGLNPDRPQLRHRIDRRVERMFQAGLIHEAQEAVRDYPSCGAKVLESLGYRQACAALRGEISEREAVLETQAATRRYAKRQMTWFRREADVTWFAGFGDDPELQHRVLALLRNQFPE
jgi:tRNA dimethylallyltransferase